MAHAQLPVKGRGEGASKRQQCWPGPWDDDSLSAAWRYHGAGTAGGGWLRQVCVRDESLDRGRGPERGGSLGARARARSRQLCDPMRTRGGRWCARQETSSLTAAAEAETGSRGEVDATSLLAWREHGRDSEGIRSAEADGGSGLGVDGRVCGLLASQLPGCQPGCWDLELHASPGSVLDSLDQTGRRVGQQRGEPGPYCGRTGYGMQSASLFLLGLGGGRLDGSGRGGEEGVPVSNERSSIAGSLLTTAERSRSSSRRRR